jgi:hypothetical protein
MKFIKPLYQLTTFLILIVFSQFSNAIIITNYTALYEDGSKLVVNLKNYDYGEGSYFASPTAWNEIGSPPIESFATFFYPSGPLQAVSSGYFKPAFIESPYIGDGLYFTVDDYDGVSMTNLRYLFGAVSSGIVTESIDLPDDLYHTKFSGGFFNTELSPYQVDGPNSLALLIIGITGLVFTRKF